MLKKIYEKLHEDDSHVWLETMAKLIADGRVSEIDTTNLSVYLIEQSKAESRAVESQMIRLATHLLKFEFQPAKRSRSWRRSINDARLELDLAIGVLNGKSKKNASMAIRKAVLEDFSSIYQKARKKAASETNLAISIFPEKPPFTFEQMLSDDWWPS